MNSPTASREQALFNEALELPAGRREEFLDTHAPRNSVLRARVEALLHAATQLGEFLGGNECELSEGPGARIGAYRLIDRVGEGGFGVVYRAEQEFPVRRTVALKIVKLGMDTRAVVARFEAERQTLALMDHPNIARVFDGGATAGGRPYFVMELVTGTPLIAFCREHRLTIAARLGVFLQVCRAVHHAHQKGIIHRDLKPSNVLVTLADGRPVAKVIDFGIAKAMRAPLSGETQLSRLHPLLGTPAYMSPEQLRPDAAGIDTRTDIFSLGALLYELLTEATPFAPIAGGSLGLAEWERRLGGSELVSPVQRLLALPPEVRTRLATERGLSWRELLAVARGDLSRVVRKCLETDRTRRYETTEDLARDLERYLRNEPVAARAPTFAYRAGKFVKRHRNAVVGVMAGLAVLAAVTVYQAQRLAAERDRAQLAAQRAEGVSSLLLMQLQTIDPYASPSDGPGPLLERVRQDFADDPARRLEILATVGRALLRRGQSAQAGAVLHEALRAGGELESPTPFLGQVLSDLGVLRRERGDFPGSERFLQRAVATRRQIVAVAGKNALAASLVELGRTYLAVEQPAAAARLFAQALRLRRADLGAEHREVATSLGDMATVEAQSGHLSAAEDFARQSAAMHRRTVGAEHPNYAGALAVLAGIRLDQGEVADAEALWREAVGIFSRTLGPKHWRTARAVGQMAVAQRTRDLGWEAEKQSREALETVRLNPMADPLLLAWLETEVGRGSLLRNEAREAEALFRSALEKQRGRFPEHGWHIAITRSLLGEALLRQGRWDEAETQLAEASLRLPDLAGPAGRETRANAERVRKLEQLRHQAAGSQK